MVLKAYYDLMSQPARAMVIFLRSTGIPFVEAPVALRKGEHFTEEYKRVNPFGRVPAIDDHGFYLTESSTILKYLADSYLDEAHRHWYPRDVKLRARLDEYLDWHHLNTRYYFTGYMQTRMIQPVTKHKPVDVKRLEENKAGIKKTVDGIHSYFLRNKAFIAGDRISIADLQAACEFEQVMSAGFDPIGERKDIASWYERVKDTTNPHYDEVSLIIREVSKRIKQKLAADKLDAGVP